MLSAADSKFFVDLTESRRALERMREGERGFPFGRSALRGWSGCYLCLRRVLSRQRKKGKRISSEYGSDNANASVGSRTLLEEGLKTPCTLPIAG